MKIPTPQFSVVILCYRAGTSAYDFVRRMAKELEQAGINEYELVLVGNYLEHIQDETPRVVKELAKENPRIRYSVVKKEGMMGWDMRSGLRLATGRCIAVIDGDGQMPTEDVIKVYRILEKSGADMAKTFRVERGDGYWRKIISFFYNILFHLLFPGVATRDVNSKPKIFTRAAYEKLNLMSDDWFIDAEIMMQARRHHFRIEEIPTVFLGLSGRRSFVKLPTILEFVMNLIRYRWKEWQR